MGRLFDTAAALLGFTREISFEGQAAMWLEHLAQGAPSSAGYPFPIDGDELDFRPLLAAVIEDRLRRKPVSHAARAFHAGVAEGLCRAVLALCETHGITTVALSGGVFQNVLLLEEIKARLEGTSVEIWTNAAVPPNDGGVSLGQAALGCFGDAHA